MIQPVIATSVITHRICDDFSVPYGRAPTVEGSFEPLFDGIRQQVSSSSPPYFQLKSEDIDIKIHNDTAIVTFHVCGLRTASGELGRRALVMLRKDGKWRIGHLHASFSPENN